MPFAPTYFAPTYFAPTYWGVGGSAEPEPEPTENFLTALRTRLLAQPALDGAGVRLSYAPPNATLPHLVVNRLFSTPFINTSRSYYQEVVVQFTWFATTPEEALELGEASYDALIHGEDNPPLLFLGGYEMARFQGQTRGPRAEMAGRLGGDMVWSYVFDFTFLIGKG